MQLERDHADEIPESFFAVGALHARDLRRTLTKGDQQKLDEYLNSVREVEKRIDNAGRRGELQGWRPTLTKPDIPRPKDGYPQDMDPLLAFEE